MHKTQVFIRRDQYDALQKLVFASGEKQSALIRESIDLLLKKAEKRQLWKERLMSLSGSISDEDAEEMQINIKNAREAWRKRY